MSAIRRELHKYIEELPENRLEALCSLLDTFSNDIASIETNLNDEEKRIIANGMQAYRDNPESFIPLD